MDLRFIFNKLSNEIIQEIIVRDAFQNYAEDKLNFIKNCSKYSVQNSEECLNPSDCYTNLPRPW